MPDYEACDWCFRIADDETEEEYCGKMPAHFKVLNPDGLLMYFCAEHYDAFMAGQQDFWMKFDAEDGDSWFKPNGKPYEEEDFDDLEEE